MSNLPYRVGPSLIAGNGAIATAFIPKGTRLRMPPPPWDPDSPPELYVDVGDRGPIFPGFNHSCNANLGSRSFRDDCRLVLRDIHPGEEITVDYKLSETAKVFCNCEVCQPKINVQHGLALT